MRLRLRGSGHLFDILHLPFLKRVFHPKARRHVGWFSFAWIVMFVGSATASGHLIDGNKIVLDTFGFLLHAFGAFPLLEHAKPVWALLNGLD